LKKGGSDRPWLRFESGEEADLAAFLKSADAQRPVRVVLRGEQWGTRACEVLAGSCPEIDLRVVYLHGTCIGDAGIDILTSSAVLKSVRSLGVERCGLSNRGVERLAQCPSLHNLRELYLCNRAGIETGRLNEIGDGGAIALAGSPHFSQLETLDLWHTSVGDQGFEAIATSPSLSRLSSVIAWDTQLTQEGSYRIKAMAAERLQREPGNAGGRRSCCIHTDYDERVITD
jgi:hypothetical protein